MKMVNDTTTFFVESGNWKASVLIKIPEDKLENYDYIEGATLAIESLFSPSGELGKQCELLVLLDENGDDYFDTEYSDVSKIPDLEFGVLIACYIEKNSDNPENWWYFLSSDIFANAGQPHNVEEAKELEKLFAKQVKEFKDKQIIYQNELEKSTDKKSVKKKTKSLKKTT